MKTKKKLNIQVFGYLVEEGFPPIARVQDYGLMAFDYFFI